MSKRTVTLPEDKINRLRECLIEANEIFNSLGVGNKGKEAISLPDISPKQARENKYRKLLDK